MPANRFVVAAVGALLASAGAHAADVPAQRNAALQYWLAFERLPKYNLSDAEKKLLQEFAKPDDADPDALTAREREVLELMVEGVTSNRRLAKRLGLSENTIKFHVRNILDKLHLHNRAEVVAYALRNKIV